MIYLNSPDAGPMAWMREESGHAAEITRAFLRSEQELLHLGHVHSPAVEELERFLAVADVITIARSKAGNILVRAETTNDVLLITGRTAEVLRSYLDGEPVSMLDRGDMTVRRSIDRL